jgi:hypothetical protein
MVTAVVVAILCLLAPSSSAAPLLPPQTRVAAIEHPASQLVGPSETVLPGGSRPRAPSYDRYATGSSVAAEGGASFTASDLETVRGYLSSQGFLDDPANSAMVERIQAALDSGQPLTEGEQNFMTHELTEADLVNNGMSQEAAHEIATGTHPPFSNYDPEVIGQYPELFNENWFHYWEGR